MLFRSRRVWADTPGDHPDGVCMDADGAVWYADVGNQRGVWVCEGGAVLATQVGLDRGAFACALSRGEDPWLFVVGQIYGGPESPQPTRAGRGIPGARTRRRQTLTRATPQAQRRSVVMARPERSRSQADWRAERRLRAHRPRMDASYWA